MIHGIRHLILDLGGVILNLDPNRTRDAFLALSEPGFDERYAAALRSGIFDRFETGHHTPEAFLAEVRAFLGTDASDAQLTEAWNAMLLDFPLRRLQLLQQLRNRYDLLLLSNTNALHEQAFSRILHEAHGFSHIGLFFDKVYFSHRVGLRKPDPAIFRQILDENGFAPEHTLFIDDSPEHIAAAGTLGIRTILLGPGMTLEDHIFLPKQSRADP